MLGLLSQLTAPEPLYGKSSGKERLTENHLGTKNWKLFGPYFRTPMGHRGEDYSAHGNAWEYLPHDHARSRAYRWWARTGSPASAMTRQRLCLSLALWNGKDPIIKERIFGLRTPKAITVKTEELTII